MEPGCGDRHRHAVAADGTSVAMIDRTYGHLAAGADDYERDLLDAFDLAPRGSDGRYIGAGAWNSEGESG